MENKKIVAKEIKAMNGVAALLLLWYKFTVTSSSKERDFSLFFL